MSCAPPLFSRFLFPSSTFLSQYTRPILQCLVACLSYDEHSLGSFFNVPTKADIAKVASLFRLHCSASSPSTSPRSPTPATF